ncbi:MAG: RelA/SpoT domain-containing protein, partial [Chloroflexi bacterium]|nr:RelA/SpoT domain-containing protein [Chloroflexota bacterium]
MTPDDIVDEFNDDWDFYDEFTEKVEDLIGQLLGEHDLAIHSVTARTKDVENLRRKIELSEVGYPRLSNITDLCGIRIITFFTNDVDSVAEIIEREFDIDHENSIDKRGQLDATEFGYLSLHYVGKI